MPTSTLAAVPYPVFPADPGTIRPARVLLLLGSLDGGGAERVAVNLARRCMRHGHDVRVAVLRREGAYLAEASPQDVLSPANPRSGFAGLLAAPDNIAGMIRRARPDVLMSFGFGVDALTALALGRLDGRRPRWIVRADSNPDAELATLPIGPVGRALAGAGLGRLHRGADAVVAVSAALAKRIDERAFGGAPHTAVIHNPLDTELVQRSAAAPLPVTPLRPFIVAAGRLVRQKGFDLLIEAFAMSAGARAMDLVILGEGPLEPKLREHAHRLGVGERVRFAGFAANPWAWFARARLFVLSSRWEGFGNVISEAQACRAPVLAADCDFGPRDQILHGKTGWLCPPQKAGALAAAMDRLLADPPLCDALAEAGRRAAEAFDAERIALRYSDLFARLADAGSPDRSATPRPEAA